MYITEAAVSGFLHVLVHILFVSLPFIWLMSKLNKQELKIMGMTVATGASMLILLVFLAVPTRHDEPFQLTMGSCTAAFEEASLASSGTRITDAGMQTALLFVSELNTLPESDRTAYEAKYYADRTRALKTGTSSILDGCMSSVDSWAQLAPGVGK